VYLSRKQPYFQKRGFAVPRRAQHRPRSVAEKDWPVLKSLFADLQRTSVTFGAPVEVKEFRGVMFADRELNEMWQDGMKIMRRCAGSKCVT
jgi:hypothetical protein